MSTNAGQNQTGKSKDGEDGEGHSWHLGAAAAATFCIAIWGAVPLATKFAAEDFSGEMVGILRTVFCLPIVAVLLLMARRPMPRTVGVWLAISVTGITSFIAFPVLFSLGQSMTTASHGGLIIALAPILTGMTSAIWHRNRPGVAWMIGATIGFAGVVVLIFSRSETAGMQNVPSLIGDLLVLAGVASVAIGYVSGTALSATLGPRDVTYWANAVAAVLLLPWAAWGIAEVDLGAVQQSSWMAILYLAVFAQVINYLLWYWAMGKAGVARISAFQYVQPVVTLVLAVVILDEALSPMLLTATALILVGVGLCQLKR